VKGDRMIWNYFRYSDSPLRRFVESIEIGETLLAREIMERSGIRRSDVHRVLRLLEARSMVEKIPFMWPKEPPHFDLIGPRAQARWRKKIRNGRAGVPGASYRFLGFTVSPVDDVLHLATLDMAAEASGRGV